MNKNILAIVAAAVTAAGATSAHSQQQQPMQEVPDVEESGSVPNQSDGSYVRISGTVDLVLRRDSGMAAGPAWALQPGLLRSSRLDFIVKEAISSGLAATVMLESGIAPDTGSGANNTPTLPATTGLSFGRGAHVGIGSDAGGYITMGRLYTPMQGVTASKWNDPFGGSSYGGIATVYNKISNASNSIAYTYGYGPEATFKPAPRQGFGTFAIYTLGEQPAPLSNAGKQYGINFSYGTPSWWAAYAFHRIFGNNEFMNPSAATSDSPRTTEQYIGGMYDLKFMQLHAGLNTGKTDTGSLNRLNSHIAMTIKVGARGTVMILLGRANDLTPVNGDFNTKQAAYEYDLSKRTALYTMWGNVDNSATTSVGLTGALGAVPRGAVASSLSFGLRHNF